jgi:hypothetical protein
MILECFVATRKLIEPEASPDKTTRAGSSPFRQVSVTFVQNSFVVITVLDRVYKTHQG